MTIGRGGELILTAPVKCPRQQIERVALAKRFWIYTKLAENELLFRPTPPKGFMNGEGFYSLGRSYRLLVVGDASLPTLSLSRGETRS